MSDRPPPRLRLADRQQVIPPMPLDDLLETDHQARVVWDFCLALVLPDSSPPPPPQQGGPARAPTAPRLCIALWLYATLQGIGSARALAWPGCARTITPSAGS